jgi:hypothetical protein
MKELLTVAAGGAFGSVARYLVYVLASFICSVGALFAGLYVMRRIYAPVL